MVDYCLKLSLQPWIDSHFHREIMNSMKSVTIMMIDDVYFIGVCSSVMGMGRSLENAISVMAAVYTSLDSQIPKVLMHCRIFETEEKVSIIKRH